MYEAEGRNNMMSMAFSDSFWPPDYTCHTGYDAVVQRLRDGRQMCKDVEELFKMRAAAEEKYGKELVTIAHKAGGQREISTLKASFEHLRTQIENIGNFHIHVSEVLKEEVKKIEAFRERQREQRKKFESIMEKVQRKKGLLYKKTIESKKNYELKRKEAGEAEKGTVNTTATTKHLEKVHQRAKQCRMTAGQAEKMFFDSTVELQIVHQDWEETHRSTCEVFQQMEIDRICLLRCALWDHCNYFSMQCVKNDEFYEKVRTALEQCDSTTDNNCFIEMKKTGMSPPDPIVFESFCQTENSGVTNGQAALTSGKDALKRRCSEPLLGSTGQSGDCARNSQPILTSIGDSKTLDEGYALLLGSEQATPLASDGADSYIVLYDYTAQEEDDLTVICQDIVQVLEQGHNGWWTVKKDGLIGMVPGNYLGKL